MHIMCTSIVWRHYLFRTVTSCNRMRLNMVNLKRVSCGPFLVLSLDFCSRISHLMNQLALENNSHYSKSKVLGTFLDFHCSLFQRYFTIHCLHGIACKNLEEAFYVTNYTSTSSIVQRLLTLERKVSSNDTSIIQKCLDEIDIVKRIFHHIVHAPK